jgi:hypothetical protein
VIISPKSATVHNTGVRVQVLRQQPDGSWLRIIDRPEVPQPQPGRKTAALNPSRQITI